MSVGRVLTLGLGTFAGRRYLPTLGYGTSGAAVAEIDVYVDDERIKRRDREYRERNERLRADLLLAIDGPQAAEVELAVAPYVAGPVSELRGIDYGALASQFHVLALIERAAAARRAADDDDDLLLSA